MEGKFTAVFEKEDGWWIGYVEELPGANTQGKTLEEARENLREAVIMVIEAKRRAASINERSIHNFINQGHNISYSD